MNPTDFKEANATLRKPPGMDNCTDLRVCRETIGGAEVVRSCSELSDEELAQIVQSRRVFLYVWGWTAPPVALAVCPPPLQS